MQMTTQQIAAAAPGEIFQFYQKHMDWLNPNPSGGGQGGWTPITEKWRAGDTEALWKTWEKLLPLMFDPTVEEIWIQQIPNHPTDPTPHGRLDVLSDGFRGVRHHPHLRMYEDDYTNGLSMILSNQNQALYSLFKPDGKPIVQSPLELPGVRLAAGVPPVSKAAFGAIRIPARQRPTLEHISGAKKFGANLNSAHFAPGEPLPYPDLDPLALSKAAADTGTGEGKVMIPVQALEYLRATKAIGWNCIYSGATSSAKTTTLNAAITLCPAHWRVVTVETGVAELKIPHLNWVPLFCDDSKEGMRQADILKLAMRMSPKPIPNGEIRGAEGALFAEACLTGHEGSDTSLHAGNPDEAIMRFTQMILGGSTGLLSESTARIRAAMAANVIVQMAREDVVENGAIVSVRRCVEISEVSVEGSYTEGTQNIKLRKIFDTEYTPEGPVLKYLGNSRLFEVMRARHKGDLIPHWAGR
jgi:type IV secretory pathway ATPase VirB11/archaellum biosynthesis ATPase